MKAIAFLLIFSGLSTFAKPTDVNYQMEKDGTRTLSVQSACSEIVDTHLVSPLADGHVRFAPPIMADGEYRGHKICTGRCPEGLTAVVLQGNDEAANLLACVRPQ